MDPGFVFRSFGAQTVPTSLRGLETRRAGVSNISDFFFCFSVDIFELRIAYYKRILFCSYNGSQRWARPDGMNTYGASTIYLYGSIG